MGAITWHTTENSSMVNLESSSYRCPDTDYTLPRYNYSSNEYDSFNRTENYYSNDNSNTYPNVNSTFEDTNWITGNHTGIDYYQHLDESLGWSVDEENGYENCAVNLWDTTFNKKEITSRIYSDIVTLYKGYDRNYRHQPKERRALLEEHIEFKNDGYKYSLNALDGKYGTLSGKVRNNSEKTDINLSFESLFDLDLEIKDTDRYKVKLECGYEKIFDGWFYDYFGLIFRMDDTVNELIPSYLKSYFELSKAKEWNSYINTIGKFIDT